GIRDDLVTGVQTCALPISASAAYLTVSESFPLEARALAIAFFYAVGTAIGGVASPWLFGALVGSGDRGDVFLGYLFGAGLMIGRSEERRVGKEGRYRVWPD